MGLSLCTAKSSGFALFFLLAALGAASADENHGDAGPCSLEGRGGCKDIASVTAKDAMDCMKLCEVSWAECSSWTFVSGTKACHLCTTSYLEDTMAADCAITEDSTSICTWGLTQGAAVDRRKISVACQQEKNKDPFLIMENAVKQAEFFCVEPTVTCTSTPCPCVLTEDGTGGLIAQATGDYSSAIQCEFNIEGDVSVEFVEMKLGAGDSVEVLHGVGVVKKFEGYYGPKDLKGHVFRYFENEMTIKFDAAARPLGETAPVFSAKYTWTAPQWNLEAAEDVYTVLDTMEDAVLTTADHIKLSGIATNAVTYLGKLKLTTGCYQKPSACNYGGILTVLLRTLVNSNVNYGSAFGADLVLAQEMAEATHLYNELEHTHLFPTFPVSCVSCKEEDAYLDRASVDELTNFFESVGQNGSYSGIALLMPDVYICTASNPVPGASTIIVDMFKKGWPTFDQVIQLPMTKYGDSQLRNAINVGMSPMWVGNTRYAGNTSHQPLVTDKIHFTAHGDLFLQSVRHELFHTIANSKETRTKHMNAMFDSIKRASAKDDFLAPWMGEYLLSFPDEIIPTHMGGYLMDSATQMNYAIAQDSKVAVAWMLYSIESMAGHRHHPRHTDSDPTSGGGSLQGVDAAERAIVAWEDYESEPVICAQPGEYCQCNGRAEMDGAFRYGTGRVLCEMGNFPGATDETNGCKCQESRPDSLDSYMYVSESRVPIRLSGVDQRPDATATPYFVTIERAGWISNATNVTLKTNATFTNNTAIFTLDKHNWDYRITKLTIPGCAPYTFNWTSNMSSYVPAFVAGPKSCIPDIGCVIPNDMAWIPENCMCNPGYSVNAHGICIKCRAGTYKTLSDRDLDSCLKCDAGTYSTAIGQTTSTCTSCPAGTYSTDTGLAKADSCTDCPAGKYGSSVGTVLARDSADDCLVCQAGTYRNTTDTDKTKCIKCTAGKYSAAEGAFDSDTCISCAKGTFSSAVGAVSVAGCQMCLAGSYSDSNASTTCQKCTAGKASPAQGADAAAACVDCPTGSYSKDDGASVCFKCQEGKYENSTGKSVCTDCPSNSVSAEGSILQSHCKCKTGYDGANSTLCAVCVVGKFSSIAGTPTCTSCPDTTTTKSTGSDAWDDCICKKGHTGADGKACTKCEKGFYKGVTGSGSCSVCPEAGSTTDSTGKELLSDCKCDKGYENTTGTAGCSLCPLNKYNANGTTCESCEANTMTLAEGSKLKTDCICKPGYFGADCAVCPVGKFKLTAGPQECTPCEAGSYKIATGAGSCTACPVGKTGKEGATLLTDCCDAGVDGGSVMNGLVNDGASCSSGFTV